MVSTEDIKTFGIVSRGLITLSAGTVAVSIPINDHITSVVTVPSKAIGCVFVGLNSGKFELSKLVNPKKIIKISGSSLSTVEIT